MIDPSFDTATPTMETVENFLTRNELEAKVVDLENKLSMKTQQWEYAGESLRNHAAQIARFEEALKDNEWDFDQDTLQSLADFFDITLERDYEVTVTVTFTGTVSVPYDYDIDDLENELSASLDTHYYGNSSVTVDLSEDGMEIDYHEI